MSINYAVKYATKIAERFKKASITADDCGKHPPKIEWRDNSQAGGTQNNGT